MNGKGSNMGPGGWCVCHKCGYKTKHERGVRCQEKTCPKCGLKLVREGGYHHSLIMKTEKNKGGK